MQESISPDRSGIDQAGKQHAVKNMQNKNSAVNAPYVKRHFNSKEWSLAWRGNQSHTL
eukprot:COSAG01_NODE_31216_length_601_cov_1.537849_1_plen_57_part_10